MENVHIKKKNIPEDLLKYFRLKKANRWIQRNTIIWWKRNCMPSSAKDRFTTDYEFVYFFTKNKKYYFEQVFEAHTSGKAGDKRSLGFGYKGEYYNIGQQQARENHTHTVLGVNGRNKRCVWDITTKPYKEAHFATFPEDLVKPMIQAGCPEFVCTKCGFIKEKIIDNSERINTRPGLNVLNAKSGKEIDPNKELHTSDLSKYRQQISYKENGYTSCTCNAEFTGGIVLDLFAGSGTTLKVAKDMNRNYIGIELNGNYIPLINKRLGLDKLKLAL